MKSKDLSKNKYGKLTPLEKVGRNKWRSALWKCKCDCGKETIVDAKSLRRGNTKSCGCIHKFEKGKASENYWFKTYKISADKRNLKWTLSRKDFLEIITKNCHYCGQSPKLREHKTLNGGIVMNGIDRLNPILGYVTENIVPCCKKCNQMKWDLTLEEFKSHIKKLYNHFK